MFTPPPSPLPTRLRALSEEPQSMPEERMEPLRSDREVTKQWTGRRLRWAVILVPLVVVVITAWSTYSTTSRLTQKSADPLLSTSWHGFEQESTWRQHHRRQPDAAPQSSSTPSVSSAPASTVSAAPASAASLSTASAGSTSVPVADQAVPPVPSAAPALPTPFPQPWDGNIVQNFSSVSCSNFFANMSSTEPFRQCRPFSLLLQSSSQFIDAQTNLTLMNSIIWGTCNTNVDFSQCQLNMGWFASALQTSCVDELKDSNALVTSTLTGLRAFEVMHEAGCETDPTTNTYCYINAVRNSNPVDTYYYGIPLGIPLPNTSVPICSACSKSDMALYSTALQDAVQGPLLTAMKTAYTPSAQLSAQYCGSDFATTNVNAAWSLRRPSLGIIGGFALATLLAHIS